MPPRKRARSTPSAAAPAGTVEVTLCDEDVDPAQAKAMGELFDAGDLCDGIVQVGERSIPVNMHMCDTVLFQM
jgi:hypothetical protein